MIDPGITAPQNTSLSDARYRRLVSVDAGIVMVVTDIHGDWPLYQHYRDTFLELRKRGLAQALVFTGDLIHSEGPAEGDQSLAIVLDLIELQSTLGEDLVVLLGNHEMPHIYHVPLSKGDISYTPRFEKELGTHRDAVLTFFQQRPFFVRTAAGVTLCHAGGFPSAGDPEVMKTLLSFSHQHLMDKVRADLKSVYLPALRKAITERTGIPYRQLASDYLAVSEPTDSRYDDYLIGVLAGFEDDFKLLWSALFSQNEHASGMADYAVQVKALMQTLSHAYHPQQALVTGHIGCRNGYRILAQRQHLRVASGAHAHPYTAARYLLFDAAKPIADAKDLLTGLVNVFAVG